jgi:hypothetical protein
MMLEELQLGSDSQTTVKGYLKIVEAFAKYFESVREVSRRFEAIVRP